MAVPLIALAKTAVVSVATNKRKRRRVLQVIAAVNLLVLLAFVGSVAIVLAAVNAVIPSNLALSKDWCEPELEQYIAMEEGDFYAADSAEVPDIGWSGSAGSGGSTSGASARVVMPVPEGRYRLTSLYGMRTHPVSGAPKMHAGMDFGAQPKGATDIPILAAADGVVEQSGPTAGFGQWVTIRHSIGSQTWVTVYGHLQDGSQVVQPGQQVVAGQKIAMLGNTGTSTGAHLHFEVWRSAYGARAGGAHTDPSVWLQTQGAKSVTEALDGTGYVDACAQAGAGTGGAGPWGGHENGRIPAEEMCAAPSFPGHLFRCDAASAFEALNGAFKAQFGRNINLTDSYRSYEAQVQCRANKGNACAAVGTSNHGWGLAADVGITAFDTAEYAWMKANAGRFGWVHPTWAQQSGAKPEPWHWEFAGTAGAGSGDGKTPESAKSLAQGQMAQYGWSASEFTCLDKLWTRESGWRYDAANPSSSARGIPQAMMSSHFGNGWKTSAAAQQWMQSPQEQITWGLNYIKGRYGSPCGAWSHSEAKGWY